MILLFRLRWLTVLLILVFSGNSFAQKSLADSLRLQIPKQTNDTNKIKLLIRLALLINVGQEEMTECLKQVNDLSRKNHYRPGLIYGRYYEGLVMWDNNHLDSAFEKIKSAIDGLDSLHITQLMNNSPLHMMRLLFYDQGKQTERFQYYLTKAAYYRKYGPVENTAACYHSIAGYFYSIGDYDKAIEFYLRARAASEFVDAYGYASEGSIVGNMYLLWGNLEKARYYLESGLNDFLVMNNASMITFIYNNLGDLCVKQHEYQRALHYYYLEKKYWPDIQSQFVALNMVSIAAVHLQMNNTDSARIYLSAVEKMEEKGRFSIVSNHGPLELDFCNYLYYKATGHPRKAMESIKVALQRAKTDKNLPLVLKYTNELHTYLLKKGDSIQSLCYLIQYQTIQDSLTAINTKAKIATFEIEQQQQKKEKEIEQLLSQKAKQRNYFLFGGIILTLIVLAVLSRLRYKRKRDKEQLSTEFKKQLAQAEARALRAQLNPHFIFNSLNSINSFVMDQKHEIASDYLIKFSKLIRLILDNSRSETISIEKELETLKLYVLLESARFDDRFKCEYNIDKNLNISSIMIPPM
ncbi:MAG: histidine kinase, partial [Bacteroidetes bacterium]|nr:histidine kinase [Bacteroidota bacterium]